MLYEPHDHNTRAFSMLGSNKDGQPVRHSVCGYCDAVWREVRVNTPDGPCLRCSGSNPHYDIPCTRCRLVNGHDPGCDKQERA